MTRLEYLRHYQREYMRSLRSDGARQSTPLPVGYNFHQWLGSLGGRPRVAPTYPGAPNEAGLKAVKLAKQKEIRRKATYNKLDQSEYGRYKLSNV
jgi:hypothetical protein